MSSRRLRGLPGTRRARDLLPRRSQSGAARYGVLLRTSRFAGTLQIQKGPLSRALRRSTRSHRSDWGESETSGERILPLNAAGKRSCATSFVLQRCRGDRAVLSAPAERSEIRVGSRNELPRDEVVHGRSVHGRKLNATWKRNGASTARRAEALATRAPRDEAVRRARAEFCDPLRWKEGGREERGCGGSTTSAAIFDTDSASCAARRCSRRPPS